MNAEKDPVLAVRANVRRLVDRERGFPEAGMSDPQGAVAWYAIGAGEGEPANYIKMSFNLSRLPDDTKVVTIPGSERIDLQLADGVWLCITKVGDSLA